MDPLDLRLDENPPEANGLGRYLVRLRQALLGWSERLLSAIPRRWTTRNGTSVTLYCQPWDHLRVGSSVSTVRLPDPAECPGASIVLAPDSSWGTTSIVSTGGNHVDGVSAVLILDSWAWVKAVSYGAPVVTGSGVLGGWRLTPVPRVPAVQEITTSAVTARAGQVVQVNATAGDVAVTFEPATPYNRGSMIWVTVVNPANYAIVSVDALAYRRCTWCSNGNAWVQVSGPDGSVP